MKLWIKKAILIALMLCSLSTLLLTWTNIHNVQSLNGTVILSGNLFLSAFILGLYFVSVLFFEKCRKVFFCTGISSLSMLFAIMFSKFEASGRFANTCLGPYAGLLTVLITVAAFVVLLNHYESHKQLSVSSLLCV